MRIPQDSACARRSTQEALHGEERLRPTLTYATVVQAPINVFAGGISIGFCPKAPLTKAVCRGLGVDWSENGKDLLPAAGLRTPWVVLPYPEKASCSGDADAFLNRVVGVKLISPSTKEGGGPMSEEALLARAIGALSVQKERAESAGIERLPLVEVPAIGKPHKSGEGLLAVMISGDGEADSLCRHLDASVAQVIELPGEHHFDGDYPALARKILSLAGLDAATP